jgi:hypothetical protein
MRDAYLVVLEAGGGNLALDNVVLQDIRQLGGVLGQQQGVQGRLGHFCESLSESINKHVIITAIAGRKKEISRSDMRMSRRARLIRFKEYVTSRYLIGGCKDGDGTKRLVAEGIGEVGCCQRRDQGGEIRVRCGDLRNLRCGRITLVTRLIYVLIYHADQDFSGDVMCKHAGVWQHTV